jgi:hypothetical protein
LFTAETQRRGEEEAETLIAAWRKRNVSQYYTTR